MNPLLLTTASDTWLSSAIVLVSIFVLLTLVISLVLRSILTYKYIAYNKIAVSSKHTAFSAARHLLDENGMSDTKVKPASTLRSIVYGNSYSKRDNTIYLRKNIINSTSTTAISIAYNKVALVMQDKEGGKFYSLRAKISPFVLLSSYLIIPLLLLSIMPDFVYVMGSTWSIISVIFSSIVCVLIFTYLILTIPVFSRANKLAIEFLPKTNHLNNSELVQAKQLFTTYVLSYVFEFVICLLLLIKIIFKVLMLII